MWSVFGYFYMKIPFFASFNPNDLNSLLVKWWFAHGELELLEAEFSPFHRWSDFYFSFLFWMLNFVKLHSTTHFLFWMDKSIHKMCWMLFVLVICQPRCFMRTHLILLSTTFSCVEYLFAKIVVHVLLKCPLYVYILRVHSPFSYSFFLPFWTEFCWTTSMTSITIVCKKKSELEFSWRIKVNLVEDSVETIHPS